MRELKFRVWDTKLKIMTPWYPTIPFDSKELIVTQCIGIKDKKGCEIYEGDILRLKYQCQTGQPLTQNEDEVIITTTLMVRFKTTIIPINPWQYDYNSFEIIGNRFQKKL